MTDDKFNIQLRIANKTYPITVNRSTEETYRKAAKLIQQRIDRYTASFFAEDKQDYYAMVMLDLAIALVTEQNIEDRLQTMVDKLDQTLQL
ncbi:MAG: cell division protein ZapA [Bacteroidaceae bacterium]|nr:cell division protein ZapA [Bacteroidaceae bacterium]MBR3733507.1 cell division protein ZapA [Bacteroidaceae bacterium]